jgi:flagellar motility protein MotE (MotC chaperone)
VGLAGEPLSGETVSKIALLVGMTLTFPLVLFAMVLVLQPDLLHQQTTQPSKAAASGLSERARSRATHRRTTPSTSRALRQPLDLPSSLSRSESTRGAASSASDPAAFEQLGTLKKELKQQIDGLKRDRDAMIANLAQTLAVLPPASVAKELEALDDESAVLVLKPLSAARRQEVLARVPSERARRLGRLLQAGPAG